MISVCMATKNSQNYIRHQLDSILIQLEQGDEVVISDSESQDETIPIIQSISDPRIKIHVNVSSTGFVDNFMNALSHAKGEYLFLADHDDIWMPNKIIETMKYLKDFDVVVSDCIVVDENLNIVHPSYFELVSSKPGFLKNISRNSYLGCCMAFNRKTFNLAIPFPSRIVAHDIWIGLLMDICGDVIFVPEKLIMYRRHSKNASFAGKTSNNSYFYRLSYRLYLIVRVFIRSLRVIRMKYT